eukprot:5200878-Pleurochrysis_carterae.AAC.3
MSERARSCLLCAPAAKLARKHLLAQHSRAFKEQSVRSESWRHISKRLGLAGGVRRCPLFASKCEFSSQFPSALLAL